MRGKSVQNCAQNHGQLAAWGGSSHTHGSACSAGHTSFAWTLFMSAETCIINTRKLCPRVSAHTPGGNYTGAPLEHQPAWKHCSRDVFISG